MICRASTISALTGTMLGISRLFVMDADGGNMKMLTEDGNSRSMGIVQSAGRVIDLVAGRQPGTILLTRTLPARSGSGHADGEQGRGLWRRSGRYRTLKRRNVERPKADATEYITDGFGEVRVMGMMPSSEKRHTSRARSPTCFASRARASGSRSPRRRSARRARSGSIPTRSIASSTWSMASTDRNGFRALYRQTLDGSGKRELVLGRDDVDVDGLVRIGRQQARRRRELCHRRRDRSNSSIPN